MGVFEAMGLYLGVGAIALFLFDCQTKRLRTKIADKSTELQSTMASSNVPLPGVASTGGTYVGSKTALVILIAATWLFWPAVFLGALIGKKGGKQ